MASYRSCMNSIRARKILVHSRSGNSQLGSASNHCIVEAISNGHEFAFGFDERSYDDGIKVCAGLGYDHGFRQIMCECSLVNAPRCQGVVHISRGNNSASQRNVLALDSVGPRGAASARHRAFARRASHASSGDRRWNSAVVLVKWAARRLISQPLNSWRSEGGRPPP